MFNAAEMTRAAIPIRSKGFLQPISDVFVFVMDHAGAISEMTGLLAREGLSIMDIELLKIREGTGGTFRLGLNSESEAERSRAVLIEAGYRVHRL